MLQRLELRGRSDSLRARLDLRQLRFRLTRARSQISNLQISKGNAVIAFPFRLLIVRIFARQSVATPATPSITSNARFNPLSRPFGSYHSASVCDKPACPPAPSVIAGIPRAIGKFESVDACSSFGSKPTALVAASANSTRYESAGVLPVGRVPIKSSCN